MLAVPIPTSIPIEARPEACCSLSDGRGTEAQKTARGRGLVCQPSAGQRGPLRTGVAAAAVAGASSRRVSAFRLPFTRPSALSKNSVAALRGHNPVAGLKQCEVMFFFAVVGVIAW
ncbi:hypothetical protein CBR_g70746 [Chara braunii]|uniref:Uncharacterized protein n=1 Tax=Chara braunii TaxID=69332 RepID=A0A388K9Z7_CHABU|nr:hypothetical protein CBR_g70746 [Chara braunii]|eukprot:GBG66870.1 hypothetical protein CBR_g70746 [Chara braunii]